MRYLLSLLITWVLACPVFGQVTGAEYFVDTDPGYGNATGLTIASGTIISRDFLLSLATVAPGFHVVSVRARDAQGHWSQTYSHSFFTIAPIATSVAANEFFIDTDPGYGNAVSIPVAVGSNNSLNYNIPLSTYAIGFHTIGVRSKDNLGKWSQTTQHAFYLDDHNLPVNITALQYYFTGNGATDSVYTYPLVTPSTNVNLDFTAQLSQLVSDREYTMHIWAVNAKGARSEVFLKKIKACSGDPVKAGFDFIPLGTQVSFIDSSKGQGHYKWDFGDGTVDSVSNPIHRYNNGGSYTVQMILSNLCNSDTITRMVNVLSLQSIFPNVGGNTGTITCSILGSGFTDNVTVKLIKDGVDIIGKNIIVKDQGKFVLATFELYNHQLGEWNLSVSNNNNSQILENAVSIENGFLPDLMVDIQGRDIVRIGSAQKYSINVTNLGNINATGIPVWFAVPKNTIVKFDFEILAYKSDNVINFDTVQIFQSTDSIFGQPDSVDVYGFFLKNISPTEKYSLNFELTFNNTGGSFYAWANKPFYGSPLKYIVGECVDALIRQATSFIPAIGCAYAISDLYLSPIVAIDNIETVNSFSEKFEKYKFSGQPISQNIYTLAAAGYALLPMMMPLAKIVQDCSGLGSGLRILENAKDIYNLWSTGQKLRKSGSVLFNCGVNLFKKDNIRKKIISALASFDPNEKTGPRGNTIENYNQGSSAFNYKIYFENKNTATAPAQEVVILDTLDKTKFDLSTFQVTSFGFGDSATSIPSGLRAYFTTNLLHRVGKPDLLVKTDAKLDTATGILKWRFLSLDPSTRELITDPTDGFLPPNITSPQGEGFISYSITPKAGLANGTIITNKATIYFDNNAPITTNTFLNTIDKIKPLSAVNPTPAEVYDTTFTVQWNGTDNASGIRSYDVYYKVNNGPFQLWQYDVALGTNDFTGQKDSVYSFFSIAKDYAGNIEPPKTSAERVVTVKIYDSANKVCPNTMARFSATSAGSGFNYQWQVNTGNGFTDLQNSAIYSGTNSINLVLNSPPTSFINSKYRCKISNGTTMYYSSIHFLKFETTWLGVSGNAWETPANWSCGVVPDENTDVIIPKVVPASPVVNVNASCKSISMHPESNVLVKTGVNLIVTGKL